MQVSQRFTAYLVRSLSSELMEQIQYLERIWTTIDQVTGLYESRWAANPMVIVVGKTYNHYEQFSLGYYIIICQRGQRNLTICWTLFHTPNFSKGFYTRKVHWYYFCYFFLLRRAYLWALLIPVTIAVALTQSSDHLHWQDVSPWLREFHGLLWN